MVFACKPEFATDPIADALRRRGWRVVPLTDAREALLEGDVDIILGPPLDYARSLGVVDLALVPGLGVFTLGSAGLVKMIFRKGLATIETVALKDPRSTESFLVLALLAEKHELEPRIIESPPEATGAEMLALADCALLVGDDAIFDTETMLFDISDEWEDLTETALPYLIGWGRIGKVPRTVVEELRQARAEALERLPGMATFHPDAAHAGAFVESVRRGDVLYQLSREEDEESLETFFQYAFYYGVIDDVPSVKFLSEPMENPRKN